MSGLIGQGFRRSIKNHQNCTLANGLKSFSENPKVSRRKINIFALTYIYPWSILRLLYMRLSVCIAPASHGNEVYLALKRSR